jgi:hypothetical protein
MAGILDSKSRVLDVILTAEGKRQMAEGTFVVKYASFTDREVAYQADSVDGHVDPTGRIYFEAACMPHDQVTFEANDDGKLKPFRDQNYKITSVQGNVSGTYSQALLKDGILTAYGTYHGRRIKVSDIQQNPNDRNKGLFYTDSSGNRACILVDPRLTAGTYSSGTFGIPGAYVGTAGSVGATQFASSIAAAIMWISASTPVKVNAVARGSSVYLDNNSPADVMSNNLKLYLSGTLTAPLELENALLGGRTLTDPVESADFASQIQGILTSSFDNFSDLGILSTVDRLWEDESFVLSRSEVMFDLSKASRTLLEQSSKAPPALSSIDSIFSDDKMSHLDNFKYLPPIVKVSDSVVKDKTKIENLKPYFLGDYPSWGENEKKLTFKTLGKQLASSPPEVVDIIKSSRGNSLMAQIFEISNNTVTKLDLVDFGKSDDGSQHVYFAGKTFLDNRGTTVFVNIFTFVFSKGTRNTE